MAGRLARLAIILEETQTQCYAWALIPNHFHLMLRTGSTPLSKIMRRLMTGYAVTFNKRHACPLMPEHTDGRRERIGHLFQNRYKSIVCEEDPYLLELIRYIHLNPLRAGLVKDLRELDKYPWSGHSVILGRRQNPFIHKAQESGSKVNPENPVNPVESKPLAEKTIEDILLHFGDTLRVARRRYREFVKDGVEQGRRPELRGGGLVRSAGGNKAGLLGRNKEEREKGDERILGSGDFVSRMLHESYRESEKRALKRPALETITEKVITRLCISPAALFSGGRNKQVSDARSVISYLAITEAGYMQKEVGDYLNVSRIAVRNSLMKGKKLVDMSLGIWEK
jgi:putative transposase